MKVLCNFGAKNVKLIEDIKFNSNIIKEFKPHWILLGLDKKSVKLDLWSIILCVKLSSKDQGFLETVSRAFLFEIKTSVCGMGWKIRKYANKFIL